VTLPIYRAPGPPEVYRYEYPQGERQMEWTFWLGIVGIAVLWGVTQWAFSLRRHSEKTRGADPEASDAMLDAEKAKEQGRSWSGF
jgi:hypothetical protein